MQQKKDIQKLHIPVLLSEVLDILKVSSGGSYVDATFGEGGHTEAFLAKGVRRVLAIDRDRTALEAYEQAGQLRKDERLELRHGHFSAIKEIVGEEKFDGILADLGPSTRQLLQADRGFSFQAGGPLDMRMDQSQGHRLEDCLLTPDLEQRLYQVQVRGARSVARRIRAAAEQGELKNTLDLARLAGPRSGPRHPATELFLALRMLVNRELEEVETALPDMVSCLKPGGRLAIITFHSVEDRLVKRWFKKLAGECICEHELCSCPRRKEVRLVKRKAIAPSSAEVSRNARARSAKLRCVEKVATPD